MNDHSGTPFAFPHGPLARRIRERKRPVQRRSMYTVEAILEAALRILADEGLARLNTTRVAERAGVSVGTLYQYFPNKSSIIAAVQASYAEKITAVLRVAAERCAGKSLVETVAILIDTVLKEKIRNLLSIRALRETQMESWMTQNSAEWLAIVAPVLMPHVLRREQLPILMSALEGAMGAAAIRDPKQLASPSLARELRMLAYSYLTARSSAQGRTSSDARAPACSLPRSSTPAPRTHRNASRTAR